MNNKNENEPDEIKENLNESLSIVEIKPRKSCGVSTNMFRVLRFGSILQTWAEVSKINFLSALTLDDVPKEQRYRSISFLPKFATNATSGTLMSEKINPESTVIQHFPRFVTSLLNEEQLWGCYYTFPELYDDIYSPVVPIRNIADVPEIEEGVLTRDMVTPNLTYLKRSPVLGDYVYIKLNLSSYSLVDIGVLKHYKYLVYLDLSSNLITDLSVLSNLLYLQYLSVDYNRLKAVLDYETTQWFLTEVHYRHNCVLSIRDLSDFWSITILDLSHNNIKYIGGLKNLRYLRRLDLSFNHIQRLENISHLRLTWLDVSYNNISSFECGPDAGLWTLLHLEYVNLNENNLSSLKIFSDCTRLREIHARNNNFSLLLDLAVYMSNLRSLVFLDLRSNPVCSVPGYKDVVYNTFPLLLSFDSKDVDPVEQRSSKMDMAPDIITFATNRLLRLLYIQQLSRSRVSRFVPPADTTDIPIVVIVGYEGVGKGTLARRLATECSSNVELALQHTTAHHFANHYKLITRQKFDDMLLTGDLLTYSELDGESYGLSREEAYVKDGKIKIVTMDLVGALMLKLRGYKPYLILATCFDKQTMYNKQQERRDARNTINERKITILEPMEISTLQVLLSGRLIINGILNEILQTFPDETEHSEFVMGSECSLLVDSEHRKKNTVKVVDRIAMNISSSISLDGQKNEIDKSSCVDSSLYSLYKEQPGMDEYVSDVYGLAPFQEKSQPRRPYSSRPSTNKQEHANVLRLQGSRKSSKSVAFTSPENSCSCDVFDKEIDPTGLLVEPQLENEMENLLQQSFSAKAAWPHADGIKPQDSDLWLAFLLGNGLFHTRNTNTTPYTTDQLRREIKINGPDFIVNELGLTQELPTESFTTNIKDDYEEIHRKSPGLFWDTVTMDNPDKAFKKMKTIIKNIVNSQENLKPMFDIDFANSKYPSVEKRLANICSQIAPQRLFY